MAEQLPTEINERSTRLSCPGCGREFNTHLKSQVYCSSECSFYAGRLGAFCLFCNTRQREIGGEMSWERFYDRPSKEEDIAFKVAHQECRLTYLTKHDVAPKCRCHKCKANRDNLGIPEGRHRPEPRSASRVPKNPGHQRHRQAVLERDGFICQLCGYPTDPNARMMDDAYPHLDHIEARMLGGADDLENLQTSHRYCNIIKGSDPVYWQHRLLLEDLAGRYAYLLPEASAE